MKKQLNLEDYYQFKDKDIIVLACSTGPDSMALFHMLLELRKQKSLYLICAHVNHNIRKASKKEQIFMEEYCKRNDVIFETMTIEKYSDDNFHNEARDIRYQFFKDIVKKYQANYLLTAHHADDLMETILMRLTRGSTLEGYAGFKKEIDYGTYHLIRPLFNLTKEEIFLYNSKNKVPFFEDASNNSPKYTRNRYRKSLLPFLKKEDNAVHEKFIKFSTLLDDTSEFIEQAMIPYQKKAVINNTLNLLLFNNYSQFIKKNIIYQMLKDFYQDDLMLLQDRHVELIMQLSLSPKANSKIYLPNSVIALKSYDTLTLERSIKEIVSYEIELSDYAYLPNTHHIELIKDCDTNGNDVIRLNSKEIVLPLTIRTRFDGDKMTLKGSNHHRKINDIFIDEKIATKDRDLWPIVCDAQGEIVFLPLLKKSKYDKQKNENYDIIIKYY